MATCPRCERRYDDVDGRRACPEDGATLLPDAVFAEREGLLKRGATVGEYTVEHLLGVGGFGAVYRAVQPLIGKTVAIKVLNRACSANPQVVSRFVAEARAVNQIQHRNIIDIFGFGQLPDGRHYYVMELLRGKPLDAWLDERGPISLEAALPILRPLARALDAAHAKGIAHRDLKPENVFLVMEAGAEEPDAAPSPKLLDFGIAKLLSDESREGAQHRTHTGAPIGTPMYMSPEQCRGIGVDHRTDIYSFGVMLFRMLTGRLPFVGCAFVEIAVQHVASAPPRPSSLAPLPPALDERILGFLEKDPAARPSTLAAGVRALEDLRLPLAAIEATPLTQSLDLTGQRPSAAPGAIPAEAALASSERAGGPGTLLSTGENLPPGTAETGHPLRWAALGSVVLLGALAGALLVRPDPAPPAPPPTAPSPSGAGTSPLAQPETSPSQPVLAPPSALASVPATASGPASLPATASGPASLPATASGPASLPAGAPARKKPGRDDIETF